MNRFEELARLKEEAEIEEALPLTLSDQGDLSDAEGSLLDTMTPCPENQLLIDLRNAAPWLLQIAEAFRPGDAQRLALLILNEQQRWTDERWQAAIDCLRRLQAAAEEMER